jgi:hypothetical protein
MPAPDVAAHCPRGRRDALTSSPSRALRFGQGRSVVVETPFAVRVQRLALPLSTDLGPLLPNQHLGLQELAPTNPLGRSSH